MRRLIIWAVSGVLLINLLGIVFICINFFSLDKEIGRTLLIGRSLVVRAELFDKAISILDEFNKGGTENIQARFAEIDARFSECYSCHHSSDILSKITAARTLFDKTSRFIRDGRNIDSKDLSLVVHGFVTYAFKKAR